LWNLKFEFYYVNQCFIMYMYHLCVIHVTITLTHKSDNLVVIDSQITTKEKVVDSHIIVHCCQI